MRSDAFMRSPAVAALFRSGILSVSPRAFFCFATDVLRRFLAFGFMRSPAVKALPLRNFVSIVSGLLLFCGGCAQMLFSVRLYAFSGCERASAPEFYKKTRNLRVFSIPVCRMCLKMRSFRAFYPNHFM